jgi:hypothetical protein
MYVSVHKYGYGACGGAALSALFEVMIRKPFFIIMRDATVQLCCCVFLQSLANWSHREQPGAKTSCNHCHIRQCLISATVVSCTFNFLGERLRGMYDFIWSQVQSRKKMLRRIKSVLEVAWRSCSDASRVSWKLVEEDVATWYAMSLRRRRRASTWSHQWSPQFLHVGRPITRRKTHEILANLEAWPRGRVGIDWWASNVTPSGYWTDSYNWFLMAYLVRWCMIYMMTYRF